MSYHFPWNCEHVARLERGVAAKETWAVIAEDIGLSENSLRAKVVALDLLRPANPSVFWTPENVAVLREYVAAGMPYSEIGKLLGCTKNMAIGKARRLGIAEDSPIARGRREPDPATLLQRLAALDVFPPSRGCVYPIGEPGHDGFHFCAADTGDITITYCPEHDKLCRPNAQTLANIAAWENDPERHLRQQADARRRGLAKMRGNAA